MPDPSLSDAIKEAYASAPSDVVIINTLELRHPAFDQPIRVALSYEPVTARLEKSAPVDAGVMVDFQPFTFELTLPEVTDTGVPDLTIRIDNVSREIMGNIELAVPEPQKLEVTYRAFMSNDLSYGPHNDPLLHLNINWIEADAFSVQAKASIADFANKKFPGENYTDVNFPGLVGGA